MHVHKDNIAGVFFGERDREIGRERGNSRAAFRSLEDQQLPGGALDHQRHMARGRTGESLGDRGRGNRRGEEFAGAGAHGRE